MEVCFSSDFRIKRVWHSVREAGVIGLTTTTLHPSLHLQALLTDGGSLENNCHCYVLVHVWISRLDKT